MLIDFILNILMEGFNLKFVHICNQGNSFFANWYDG